MVDSAQIDNALAEEAAVWPVMNSTNTPPSDLSYKAALEIINGQTGPMITILKKLSECKITAVLYSPVGATLAIQDGIVLKAELSVASLITMLQMYIDHHIIQQNHEDSFIIESIRIRIGNNEENDRYPPLSGKPWFETIEGGRATPFIIWETGGSELEIFWEAYRNMILMLSISTDRDPVFKVHTVQLLSPQKNIGRIVDKELGSGHYFKHNTNMFDMKSYFTDIEQSDLIVMAKTVSEMVKSHTVSRAVSMPLEASCKFFSLQPSGR